MTYFTKVTEDTYWVGVNDHQTDLFESLWPLPKGVTYNSYLIKDEKSVLIDTVKAPYLSDLIEKIKAILGDGGKLDYLVINHMEPDHSGAVKILRAIFPELKIIGNAKTKEMLNNFYGICDDIVVIKDGDVIDLGKHKLAFYLIPMVHWPETMVTFDTGTGALFSCDAFGGFGTLDGGLFDDELDMNYYEEEVLRYFSNIVARYSTQVQKAIAKLKGLDIKIVAPSHGPIHRKNPERIIKLYDRWSKQETECGAVVVFGSMYGNTQKMAEAVAKGMAEQGLKKLVYHDISRSHVSYVVKDIWKMKGLILASCTYNTTLFPPMNNLLNHLSNKNMKGRKLGIVGSYSWGKGAFQALEEFASPNHWDLIGPTIEIKSCPFDEDIAKCMELGRNMADQILRCYD